MKKIIILLFILQSFVGCTQKTDNTFAGTKMYLETNKKSFQVSDTIEITVVLIPEDGEKKVSFLKNFLNLRMSFDPVLPEYGFNQELKKQFIENPGPKAAFESKLDEYTISKEHPFKKTLKVLISQNEYSVFFEIPELHIKNGIRKSNLKENPTVIISGFCDNAYTGIVESTTSKKITVKLD